MTEIVTLDNLSDDFVADHNDQKIKIDWTRADSNKPQRRKITRQGEILDSVEFYEKVTVLDDGAWSVDYSFINFKKIISVTALGINVGTTTSSRRYISINEPSLTGVSGMMVSSSSLGLLAAVTLVPANGSFYLTVIGEV